MSIKVSREAISLLQELSDYLGPFGGLISLVYPHWALNLNVLAENSNLRLVELCQFDIEEPEKQEEDFDRYVLLLSVREDEILSAEILEHVHVYFHEDLPPYKIDRYGKFYSLKTLTDNAWQFEGEDFYGLDQRFSDFMKNLTEVEPYSGGPRTVVYYGTYHEEIPPRSLKLACPCEKYRLRLASFTSSICYDWHALASTINSSYLKCGYIFCGWTGKI